MHDTCVHAKTGAGGLLGRMQQRRGSSIVVMPAGNGTVMVASDSDLYIGLCACPAVLRLFQPHRARPPVGNFETLVNRPGVCLFFLPTNLDDWN